VRGRSPRTRRSRTALHDGVDQHGSISAHAEEPRLVRRHADDFAVDLRARGGALGEGKTPCTGTGRSPRTRRSRCDTGVVADCPGSISAHAEEPPARTMTALAMRVDLRARGGASSVQRISATNAPSRLLSPPRELPDRCFCASCTALIPCGGGLHYSPSLQRFPATPWPTTC